MTLKHAGQILVDALHRQGVKRIFGVPGESFLPVLDGLVTYPEMVFVTNRQEGGAAYMAEAYGKLTGKPGVLMVTRGPGATNASVGVHTAYQDSTPMVVLIGQVGTDFSEREAFQEIDYRRMFAPIAKWIGSIDRADRVNEYISHAFHLAQSGRPGPVVLALPEDVLFSKTEAKPVQAAHLIRPGLSRHQFKKAVDLLRSARKPMVLVGGGGWTSKGSELLEKTLEREGLPVATSFRAQDLVDGNHPCYAGDLGIAPNPKLAKRVEDADVLLVIGPRLGEMTTGGYALLEVPQPMQKVIHVHMGINDLGSVYRPEIAINACYEEFSSALYEEVLDLKLDKSAQGMTAHEEYLSFSRAIEAGVPMEMAQVVHSLNELVPRDTIITNGAGNFAAWVHRFYRYGGFSKGQRTQLAPTNGSMGYGLPAAIAAKMYAPHRTVIAFCGDGDFMMNGQELATALRYDAYPIVIVVNNGMLGTIRMHQEREFTGRISGTELGNPDFVQFAQSFGMPAKRITKTAEFASTLSEFMKSSKGGLIEIITDPNVISPTKKLTDFQNGKL